MKRLTAGLFAGALALSVAGAAGAATPVYVAQPAGAVTIDGQTGDWAGVKGITINNPDSGVDPATIYAQWDANNLYFLVVATDAKQVNDYSGGGIWQGDSLQISLDTGHEKNAGGYDGDDFEFGWALTSAGPDQTEWHTADATTYDPSKIKYSIVRGKDAAGKDATIYEIALPADQVKPMTLQKGTTVGFEWLLNDDDGSGRMWTEWTGGIGATKDPSLYNDLQLG